MKKPSIHTFLVSAMLMALTNCSFSNLSTSTGNCQSTPSYTGLSASSTSSISHRVGESCLSCHGGSVTTVFAAAGTLYSSASSNTAATSGTVTVGGQALTVDSCGNFYTTSVVDFTLATSGPGGSMMNPVPAGYTNAGVATSGDCNLYGCHDGSSSTIGTSGIRIY